MALENLYRCTKEELYSLPEHLADVFFTDELYVHAFPKESTRRECMVFFFQHYLEAIAPDCIFLADSKEMNAIMVVYDSRRYQKKAYGMRLLKMNMKFIHFLSMLGVRQFLYLMKNWDMFSSRWINDFETGAYFHLDLLFTQPAMRHQGIATHMVRELIDEGDIMAMDISVETHHYENALWYEKLGFVLMNTIVDEDSGLHQYCLIERYRKESKSWIQNIE